jgi:hypothetical protein
MIWYRHRDNNGELIGFHYVNFLNLAHSIANFLLFSQCIFNVWTKSPTNTIFTNNYYFPTNVSVSNVAIIRGHSLWRTLDVHMVYNRGLEPGCCHWDVRGDWGGGVFFILDPLLPKVSLWTTLLKTPVINHTDVQRSSQWVSPDDGDIRRRNICREVIVFNKKCIRRWLCSFSILTLTVN